MEFDVEPTPNMEEVTIGSIHKWICVKGIGSYSYLKPCLLVLLMRGPLFVVLYALYCKVWEMSIVS